MTSTVGSRFGRALFSILAFGMAMFAIVLFVAVGAVALQFGTTGTGFMSGLTLALIVVVVALGSYMMARAFAR